MSGLARWSCSNHLLRSEYLYASRVPTGNAEWRLLAFRWSPRKNVVVVVVRQQSTTADYDTHTHTSARLRAVACRSVMPTGSEGVLKQMTSLITAYDQLLRSGTRVRRSRYGLLESRSADWSSGHRRHVTAKI